MKKRNIMTIAAVAAMLCACDFRNELIDLHSQIASEEDVTINSIQAQIDAIKETIPDLEQLKADLDEYLTDLEGKETELSDAIESSNSELDQLKTDAAADIDGSYGILDAEITSYISNMEGQLDLVRNEIERLKAEDQKLSDKIAELKEYVDQQISDTYDWAEQTFMTLEQYNSLCEYITTVETDLKSANDRMESLADDVTNQFETVFPTAMANMETELKSKISAIGETVAPAVQSVVEELTASYEALFAEEFGKYEAKMKTWINEQLSGYYTMAETDAAISRLAETLDNKLESQYNYVLNYLITLQQEISRSVAANKTEISNLRTALNNINPSYNQNISDLADLAERISANSENIAKNTHNITDQDGKIDDLSDLIAGNKSLIDDNDDAIEALDEAIDAIESRIQSLTSMQQQQVETVASNARAIAANANLIQSNITAMNSCAAAISQNTTDLTAVRSSINSMSNQLKEGYDTAIEEAITKLEGKFNKAINDSLTLINARINEIAVNALWTSGELNTRVTSVQTEVNGLRTTLGSIETSVSTIKTNVEKLLARIQSMTWLPVDGSTSIPVEYVYGRQLAATATLRYVILPEGTASQLAGVPSALKVFVLDGGAGSAETEVDILSTSAEDDVLSVVVDAASLPAAFFDGSATAYMSMMVTDGNNERQSNYVPAVAAPQDADMVIPDAIFKSYLLDNFDMNADGKMTLKDSILFHQTYEDGKAQFKLLNLEIATLEGVSYFPDLYSLDLRGSNVASLDLSGNAKMKYLSCLKCTSLRTLTLPVGSMLKGIDCNGCALTDSPEFSNCKDLESLHCNIATFKTLTLTSMPKLWRVDSEGDYDLGGIFAYPKTRGSLESLVFNDCPELLYVGANYNKISSLNISGCPKLSTLGLISNYLGSFGGVDIPSLKNLNVDGNNITVLDLSKYSNIKKITLRECPSLNRITGSEYLEEVDLTNQNTVGYFGENETMEDNGSTIWIGNSPNIKNIIIPDSADGVWFYGTSHSEAVTSNILRPDFQVIQGSMPSTFYVKNYVGTSVDMADVLGISTIDFTQSPNITEILVPEGYSNTIVANEGVTITNY